MLSSIKYLLHADYSISPHADVSDSHMHIGAHTDQHSKESGIS